MEVEIIAARHATLTEQEAMMAQARPNLAFCMVDQRTRRELFALGVH